MFLKNRKGDDLIQMMVVTFALAIAGLMFVYKVKQGSDTAGAAVQGAATNMSNSLNTATGNFVP